MDKGIFIFIFYFIIDVRHDFSVSHQWNDTKIRISSLGNLLDKNTGFSSSLTPFVAFYSAVQ